MRIGITGHIRLTPESFALIRRAIRRNLKPLDMTAVTGISCLAGGADTIFAQVVVKMGGRLEVILPAEDYRAAEVSAAHAPIFDSMLAQAAEVRTMPYEHSCREAYEAANEAMLATCDRLIAVWDGVGAAAQGGTAEAVEMARARGILVKIIWPKGAERLPPAR